jgi:hypothetical protein
MPMNKKTFMAALSIAGLLIALVGVQFAEVAKAQISATVTINPEGSVTGTNSIRREDDTYTLTANISMDIQVQKSNIVLDGAGYAILGNGGGRGIDLSNGRGQDPSRPEINNVTVKNFKIVDFYYGVDNANTNNNTFIGNYIENCLNSFWIIGSKNNLVTFNTLKNADIAINYAGTSTLTRNNFIDSMVFVWLSFPPIVEGNYWSDYTTRYPNASEIGNTGVGDIPYVFWTQQNGNETITYQDNHPSIRPIDIVNPTLPTPGPLTVSLAESASALNFGNTINFTVNVEGGVAPYTYEWFVDDQLVETGNSQYYSTSTQPVGPHHIYAQVTDVEGNTAQTLSPEFNVLPTGSLSPSPSEPQQPTIEPTPTPSPSVPELPNWIILPLVAVVAIMIVYFRRSRKL